jgi:membrane protein implicated in regulation of membrane protease activity
VDILYHLNHWHWWGMAVLWIVGELLSPCGYFLAMGIAAAITGLVLRVAPTLDWPLQLAIFGVLTVVGLLVARRQQARNDRKPDEPANSA